jgi:hypothetical protein
MSSKFWDMYKGSTSYDSFDDSDDEAVQDLTAGSDDYEVLLFTFLRDPRSCSLDSCAPPAQPLTHSTHYLT